MPQSHDNCGDGVACDTQFTVVHLVVQLPPGGSNYCEGPIVFGYASDVGPDGYFTSSWPGVDFEQLCGGTSAPGCPDRCQWEAEPFFYAGAPPRDCTHTAYAVEASLEYLGNGTQYSTAFPITIPPPQGCPQPKSPPAATLPISVKQGEALILHANGSKDTCSPTRCPDTTFGIGDRVV